MATPDKESVKAFLAANMNASEGELVAAFLEEKRAAQKEQSATAVRALLPQVKASDQAAVAAWLNDGQSDGNVAAEANQLGVAIAGGDFDAIMLNVFQLAKAAIKSFNIQPPTLPPPPQV